MIDENDMCKCDYCGENQGEFLVNGNHVVCDKLIETMLELEDRDFSLRTALARLERVEAALTEVAQVDLDSSDAILIARDIALAAIRKLQGASDE